MKPDTEEALDTLLFPAVHFGTLAAETSRILGIVPPEGRGIVVDRLDIFTSVELAPSNANYWLIELGTMIGGATFVPKFQAARPYEGWAIGQNTVVVMPEVAYTRGSVVALRALPYGDPSDLTGCDVVVHVREP